MVEERVPTGFVGKIIGRNFYNRESLVKNQRERRTLGSGEAEKPGGCFFTACLSSRSRTAEASVVRIKIGRRGNITAYILPPDLLS
jgi:hypothetical protein